MRSSRWIQPAAWIGLLLLLAVGARAAVGAFSSLGQPIPSLLLDPYGSFSAVYLPSWGLSATPLKFPDRLLSVDGQAIGEQVAWPDVPALRAAKIVEAAARAGQSEVALTFLHDGASLTLRRPIRALGADALVVFFGLYALAAFITLWSALMVLRLALHRPAARAYAAVAASAYLFLITLFDYHSTRALAPLFSISTVMLTATCPWLAFTFPEPPVRGRKAFLIAIGAITVAGVSAAAWLVLAPRLGHDPRATRFWISQLGPLGLVVLGTSMLLRIGGATGRAREELASAGWGLAASSVMVAVGVLSASVNGSGHIHIAMPLVVVLVPLSVGYALVRRNILATTAVVARWMVLVPVIVCALGGAVLVAAGSWWVAERLGAHVFALALTVSVSFVALLLLGRRLTARMFFPSTAQFRPTIEQLSDELASLADAAKLRGALERTVKRWLPTRGVSVIARDAIDKAAPLSSAGAAALAVGLPSWTDEPPWQRRLLVPMRSLGELRGALLVDPEHQAALYTSEDIALLTTIASLGAVALHYAEVLGQIEDLRRLEVDVTRGERRQALALVAAEVSHEIAYPLNFFRHLMRRADGGNALEAQDLEIGREEVDRLERMLSVLRKLKPQPIRLQPVLLRSLVERALGLIRDLVEAKRLRVRVEVEPEAKLVSDPDPLLQLVANLLRNAGQAVHEGGEIEVRLAPHQGGLALEVRDDGPGIEEPLRDAIFNPWFTTRPDGSGLGLAISQRIARGFGWSLAMERESGRTCMRVVIPAKESQ